MFSSSCEHILEAKLACSKWFLHSRTNIPHTFDTNTDVESNHMKVMKLHWCNMNVEPRYIFKEVFSAVVT